MNFGNDNDLLKNAFNAEEKAKTIKRRKGN